MIFGELNTYTLSRNLTSLEIFSANRIMCPHLCQLQIRVCEVKSRTSFNNSFSSLSVLPGRLKVVKESLHIAEAVFLTG